MGRRSGKCLRVLGDSEVPLFVQYNWKSLPNAANKTFVLKEREPELRENATKVRRIGDDMDGHVAQTDIHMTDLPLRHPAPTHRHLRIRHHTFSGPPLPALLCCSGVLRQLFCGQAQGADRHGRRGGGQGARRDRGQVRRPAPTLCAGPPKGQGQGQVSPEPSPHSCCTSTWRARRAKKKRRKERSETLRERARSQLGRHDELVHDRAPGLDAVDDKVVDRGRELCGDLAGHAVPDALEDVEGGVGQLLKVGEVVAE